MKKKYNISSKDYEEWVSYTKEMEDVFDKDIGLEKRELKSNKSLVVDLHGLSLEAANQEVKKLIFKAYEEGIRKIKIITGKGTRSKNKNNPYISQELSILKNSIPEFIQNEKNLYKKIYKIFPAEIEDGGEGAFYILLKKL